MNSTVIFDAYDYRRLPVGSQLPLLLPLPIIIRYQDSVSGPSLRGFFLRAIPGATYTCVRHGVTDIRKEEIHG
ncbi:hypothetical protein [Acerihabitans arboris]|uniref:Uncharacterized protein n=1 Tax=Acerihabitans arboris TaxID=2691583 RepID=A0A845SPK8_9GAMM|nr:hypothetical protein [Acerihabitans arboris]NDL65087.1 hypothetical protein [Acerihabitans arboris]